MALIYPATLSPTKAEAIAAWLPAQPWAPDAREVELVGDYRFDDPEGAVGLETHLVRADGVVLQVPLTYRDAPLEGAEEALVAEADHSVLGRRWIYDGCADPVYVRMLASAALTGVGQAASLARLDGRWITRAPTVLVRGGGWTGAQLPVDDFGAPAEVEGWVVVRSPELEVRLARRPREQPAEGPALTATWDGQDRPVLLATVAVRDGGA